MKNKRDEVIELIKQGYKLKDIADSTGKSLNSIKKTSQMFNLYEKVEDKNLENYLRLLKHDALLFNKFKLKDELVKAIKFVINKTNGNKISRAELKKLLDEMNIECNLSPEKIKLSELKGHMEYLITSFGEEDLDKIGLVSELDMEHPSFYVLKYRMPSQVKKQFETEGIIIYDDKTYYNYILKPVDFLYNIDNISFESRYKKPLDLDIDLIKSYLESK